jgi:hypothetical protein
VAAFVATVATILVMLSPTLLPIEGYWGTAGASFGELRLGLLFGYITTRGTLRTTPADLDVGTSALSGMDGFFAARFVRLG